MADFTKQNPNQPLGDLEQNKYESTNFTYPLDLASPRAGKDHYMVFHINESTNTQFFTKNADGSFDTKNAPTDTPTINANVRRDQNGTSLTGKSGGESSGTDQQSLSRNIRRVATTIVLYMPPQITANYAADWSKTELGMSADLMNKIKGESSFADLFRSGAASMAQNLGDTVNGLTGLNLKDTISLNKRLVINNHLEVIFNGIDFRQFQFTFRFTPESEQEAQNVDNIIRAFKFYSAPEVLSGWSGRFWIYPAEFDIQYYSNGKENEFLNKISTCALTNMSVNYTATGHWAAHRFQEGEGKTIGSSSVCTDISLTFIELELMTKKRILEGY